jgi:hypothetical protein
VDMNLAVDRSLFVVTGPGGDAARVVVERVARERGWRLALSPARANVLVVAGLGEPYVSRVWSAIPAPRARVDVDASTAEARLAAVTLSAAGSEEFAGEVPMADRGPDRDGLMLDQSHVPLGPALPLWPAGLIVHTTLQGDVVQDASVELLAGGGGSFWSEHPQARALDSAGRLLALTGWTDAATTAHRLRDDVLAGTAVSVERWARRVRRSRVLRWSLPADALDRLCRWLTLTPGPDETQWTVDNLPRLLVGTDLATARLTVASLAPDLDALPRHEGTGAPVRHEPAPSHHEHHGHHHG